MNKYFIFLCAILLTSVFIPGASAARLHVSDLKLTAFDGETNDEFGISVSVDGDVALVGAEGDDGARGAAYIFERDIGGTNAWGFVAKLTAPDATTEDWFGFSVAVAGDVALVGAYGNDDAGSGSGTAYIFERNIGGTNAWGFVCKLTASDAAAYDYFGVAVAVDGDVAIVSASGDENFRGSAYVFRRNAGGTNAWGQVAKIAAPDGTTNDYFGVSVAVAGDVALAGAEQDEDLGSAYVFERNIGGTNNWGFVRKLTASDGAAGDHFGYSVSADGDAALVGVYGCDGSRGAAYVYQRNFGGTNAWGEVAKLTATDGTADDRFGWSVAIDGGTAVIGAHKDDDAGSESGAAYVFERNANGPSAWGQVRKLTASDGSAGDWFGCAVAAGGNTALIGAYRDDPSGTFSGSVYVMPISIETRSYQETEKFLASDFAVSNSFGYSASVWGDVAAVGQYKGQAAYVRERNAGGINAWGQTAKLEPLDGATGCVFGMSVSVADDIVCVGSINPFSYPSAAYIYERNANGENAWGQISKLVVNTGGVVDAFGYSTSIAGDKILIGAPYEDSRRGSAYIFQRDSGTAGQWAPCCKLLGSESDAFDFVGWSVAISDDVALLGSWSEKVYVFEQSSVGTNAWLQTATLSASNSVPGDVFGICVDVSGDVALIGAYRDDEKGNDAGAAYIFERNADGTNAWGEVKKLTAADGSSGNNFGFCVSMSGDTAFIGTAGGDGAVYIFERNAGGSNAWGQVAKLTASDVSSNGFGSAASAWGDTILIGTPSDDGSAVDAGASYIFERHFPVPETEIEEMQIQGPEVVCAWTSEVPADYTMQVSGSMDDSASWSNLTGCADLPGIDGILSVTNAISTSTQHFYRIKAVNSPIR